MGLTRGCYADDKFYLAEKLLLETIQKAIILADGVMKYDRLVLIFQSNILLIIVYQLTHLMRSQLKCNERLITCF